MPVPVKNDCFNKDYHLPYDLAADHVHQAMEDFVNFLGLINQQLQSKGIPRLECLLMPATFSSIVGEFISTRIPEHCFSLAKNQYTNGHPDLIPQGKFPEDPVQYAPEGIEVKGSRHASGWQGHNPESIWLMVFYFDSHTPNDRKKGVELKPFCFRGVYAAKLDKDDWAFSGRSPTSRRTITASVKSSGLKKMKKNWIYSDLS
ncbi:hypothetical protein NBE99_06060 [Thermosynechococcus sp. HN-54]|uniref:hypothetical protein n=1 Tax=Thermosynechococcus sp. HN-54 TaxID=2933959 RepID=UPI00202CB8F7|nr:hypothetical protein [Thermosynechococcus sp. HN-54]URR36694.1 hypothetical protein NBE99_06060 [Thermosynechococcus sp. HN-54]